MSAIFDSTIKMIGHGLDLSLRRQNALGANIANLDTPGYVPKDVDFLGALERAMETHTVDDSAVVTRPDKAADASGNRVDLDMQMARVSQNATLYQGSSKAMSRKLAMLRYVVAEG